MLISLVALPLATLPLVSAPLWAAPQPSSREIVLQLGRRTISLRDNGKLISSWPVAIGSPGTPTPLGRFVVQNKVINPKYQSTKSGKINSTVGPNSPLGIAGWAFSRADPTNTGSMARRRPGRGQ